MFFYKGDYVSHVWCSDVPEALWSVWLVRPSGLFADWELRLTWDDRTLFSLPAFATRVHTVNLGMAPESVLLLRVEVLIAALEFSQRSSRLALIEVRSDDPTEIVDKLFIAAQKDARIGFKIAVQDPAPSTS